MASQFDPRVKRKPMADINVVPYIDVMLVLLVIFMITAPLLTTGVDVDLPQAAAEPMDKDAEEPLIVTVNKEGDYYLSVGEEPDKPIDDEAMITLTAAVLRHKPGTPVMIRGDGRVEYSKVVYAMTLLQQAGAPSVGLITEAPESVKKKKSKK
jgi:biopolymer transport protein TolR